MTKRSIEEGDPYAIIFMDNVMTNVNGPRATREIRSLGFEGLIIGVSGNVFEEDVEHFIESGADAVYAKPLKIDILKGILDHSTTTTLDPTSSTTSHIRSAASSSLYN